MVYGQGGLSGLSRGVRIFCALGLQGQPDGSSVRNIFEGSFTEEQTGSGKATFKIGYKFSVSEARNNFDRIDSSVQREEDRSSSPSTQEYQKLDSKLKHNLTGEQLGSDWGVNTGSGKIGRRQG